MSDAAIAPRVARELVALRDTPLPAAVVARARELLLDFVGVTLGGAPEPSSVAVRAALRTLGVAGPVAVLGTPERFAAPQAALANGAAAHALEMDDTHLGGSIHLGAPVFPAALAAAALRPDATLADVLAGAVGGYEVAARLAMALGPARHYARGLHPTGTCGAFGAAAAAGLVLGLEAERLAHALGVAGSQGAGSMEFLADGSWTKRLHPGWAACAGVHAAALAAAGFRAPATIFEGRFGVLNAGSDAPDAARLAPGHDVELLHTGVKPHACCRYMQAPIDATLALRAAHGLRPADVARVEVAIVDAGTAIVCEPLSRKRRPTSPVDAQFSLPFGIAVALARGSAGPDDFVPRAWDDPAVLALMDVVEPVRDAALDAEYPRVWPAWVRILTRDGTAHTERVRHPLGDPEHFPTTEQLLDKFRMLALRSVGSACATRIADAVLGAASGTPMARMSAMLADT